jgi:hypothetical protein
MSIADNEIAPDGKSVAYAVGQSENLANEFGPVEVDIESGAQIDGAKIFQFERGFRIKAACSSRP